MDNKKYVLVTGGLGYIGSHMVVDLIKNGYEPIVIDNLSNSNISTLKRLNKITNKKIIFFKMNLLDKNLSKIFDNYYFDGIFHFAALKNIHESISDPNKYYENNVLGSRLLIDEMKRNKIQKFIFSSSAAIYKATDQLPINENYQTQGATPYAQNKIDVENIMKDESAKNKHLKFISLRYFNPIGAHSSGLIGDNLSNCSTNIMSMICKVARGDIDYFQIYGDNFNTPDGTGIRDYIHIQDVIDAHYESYKFLNNFSGFLSLNLGTGYGLSVKQLIEAFEKNNNVVIPFKKSKRREGDKDCVYSNPSLAFKILGWKAKYDLDSMVRDSWLWSQNEKKIN